ncbi:helix-turn-helix domain-containing protein [Micromonospora lupini]|uniref:helix-turn-helix transcriptional regulator n=1 Tax=Micromonospora lupini TaxID=285679 RepID=UPI00224F7426|nr:helix-turn-helix transcriptional regulator [Micromonospora lupini]MCX5066584.1 helix-turn-helix domain-containing protein [Micromonospora lupini]
MQAGAGGDESPENPYERLGLLIAQARLDAGLTQGQLAERCGIGRATIQRLENAREIPKLETVRAIVVAIPGLDPREIPVALGLVTRDEMGLPPERVRWRRYDPATEDILAMLQDDRYSTAERDALRGLLRAQLAGRPAAANPAQVDEAAQEPQEPPAGAEAV